MWISELIKASARSILVLIALSSSVDACGSGDVVPHLADRPALVSVALYQSGESTGQTTISVREAGINAMGPTLTTRPGYWGLMNARITANEAKWVRELADTPDLRDLQPKSDWFAKCELLDVGSVLAITWKDKQVVYAIPPQSIRSNLPESAQKAYSRIDEIVTALGQLRMAYKSRATSRLSFVGENDPRYWKFREESHHLFRESLPRERTGW